MSLDFKELPSFEPAKQVSFERTKSEIEEQA